MKMDIERLKKRKQELGYTNEEVARLSGVPLSTVQKVFGNVTKQPRRDTIIALARVLSPSMANRLQSGGDVIKAGMVKEAEFAYRIESGSVASPDEYGKRFTEKEQGEYTLEDYYLIPDERRVELIDGRIYDMTAPESTHQIVVGEVLFQLMMCVREHAMNCLPLCAPVDVQLDRDEKTMVQPDVMILCDMSKLIQRCIYGAPDFVMEVLSPSTKSKDMIVKLEKYMGAGCREYWIVDIEGGRIIVYNFETEDWPKFYSLGETVPVGISNGLCKIDLSGITGLLEQIPDEVEQQADEEQQGV